ncbi:hypothetical protein H6P81_005505 [Aristolochia fimbriata]|uniref:DUF538 domain-containing protein n=1 Tax=Aristolochia fimbriata TaxID=158543 RepID=A0AAV7EVS0_ARIFI|nr:hypothetical protein H6P81_005505 [Aristolochia fimbriata]
MNLPFKQVSSTSVHQAPALLFKYSLLRTPATQVCNASLQRKSVTQLLSRSTTASLRCPSLQSTSPMAGGKIREDERAGAEIVSGAEACRRHSVEMLEELGFPGGIFPLKDLEECGRVMETGFVWMKLRAPYEHFFTGTNTLVSYGTEVTAYVEKRKMKKLTGIKSKQFLLWVPVTEMSIEGPDGEKIHFKTPMGIGKSFPVTAFLTESENADAE